eukprot:gene38126-46324_t
MLSEPMRHHQLGFLAFWRSRFRRARLGATADTGAKFEVAMSQEDIDAFLSEIVGDLSTSVAVLKNAYHNLRGEKGII